MDGASSQDILWMTRALELADEAASAGEVPVGALVLDQDGTLLAEGHNRLIGDQDPTAHAEIIALRAACRAVGNYRLPGATLYVTLEPCAMCAGAIVQARIARLVYGAPDQKGGAVAHGPQLFKQPTVHHRPEVLGGVHADTAAEQLRAFFQARRHAKLS